MRANPRGFTIIETIFVLLFAAIMVSAVIFSLPGIERSWRNQARRDIANNVFASFLDWASNHGGKYPFYDAASGLPANSPQRWSYWYNTSIKGVINDIDPATGLSILGDPGDKAHGGDVMYQWEDGPDPSADDAESCSLALTKEGYPIYPAIAASTPCNWNEWKLSLNTNYWVPPGHAQVYYDAKCGPRNEPVSNGQSNSDKNASSFIMVIGLEPAGTYYCIAN